MDKGGGQSRALARLFSAWAPALLWAGVILWFSGDRFSGRRTAAWLVAALDLLGITASPPLIEAANLALRKGAHLVEYGILGFLLGRAVMATWLRWPGWWVWCTALSLAVSCASLDEVRQAYGAARTGSPLDVLLDACAAGLGIALVLRLRGAPAATTAGDVRLTVAP